MKGVIKIMGARSFATQRLRAEYFADGDGRRRKESLPLPPAPDPFGAFERIHLTGNCELLALRMKMGLSSTPLSPL